MATLVCFHAHPDDESIATAGVMMDAVERGHRVVLVVATRGELGLHPDDIVPDGTTLAVHRTQETMESAAILGVHRVEFLPYRDSGMAGDDRNHDPDSFHSADLEEAAERLAEILREESANALTVYDENGGYGHPDHIKVNRVGYRAAELAGTPRVYEATINRDFIKELFAAAADAGIMNPGDIEDAETLGVEAHEITTSVGVAAFVETKRKAMAAHRSQIAEQSFFLSLPDEHFRAGFGTEWFIRKGASNETSLWD